MNSIIRRMKRTNTHTGRCILLLRSVKLRIEEGVNREKQKKISRPII
ncbi:hypothetical protein PAAL109150_15775 [Paenibacillus alkaliterrae]